MMDYVLNRRKLPGEMSEVDAVEIEEGVGTLSSSFRANFLPVGSPLMNAGDRFLGEMRGHSLSDPAFSPSFDSFKQLANKDQSFAWMFKHSSDKRARDLRRKFLRGSKILIFQAGYSGKRFIYERLKELGVHVTIMDGPTSYARAMAEEGVIEEFIEIDFTEWETIVQRALNLIVSLDTKFDGVMTFYEDGVSVAARIAYGLGLPTNHPDVCDRARNKSVTRKFMSNLDLPVPKFRIITKGTDMKEAGGHVGFPAILKPTFGAASLGVHRVETQEEFESIYKSIIAGITMDNNLIWLQGNDMILEEFYDGPEFDIDILLSDKEVVYAKISDNWEVWEPWYQETGMNCPSLYPEERQKELIDFGVRSALALGFEMGAFHVEVKYTSRGPRLIEVNARMGGMSVRDANLEVWGVDIVEEAALCALGIPIRPAINPSPACFFSQTAVNAPYSGTMKNVDWLAPARANPLVIKAKPLKMAGDKVKGPEDDCPHWIAEIVVKSQKSVEETLEAVRDIIKEELEVPIDAAVPGTERAFFFPDQYYPFLRD